MKKADDCDHQPFLCFIVLRAGLFLSIGHRYLLYYLEREKAILQ